MSDVVKHVWKYAILVVILVVSGELMAWFVVGSFARDDLVYDKSLITQPYTDYLNERDLPLGWRPVGSGPDFARRDPAFGTSHPCVSVFGDSFTQSTEVTTPMHGLPCSQA